MENILWYEQKAMEWEEALPLGNGTLGAMVYGDEQCERIQLNEITLWSGYEFDNDNPECLTHLEEMRKLIFDGEVAKAQKLCEKYLVCAGVGTGSATPSGRGKGNPYGSYETAGELFIDYADKTIATDYKRSLDLNRGIATVSYKKGDNKVVETIFTSYHKNVTAIKIDVTKETTVKIFFDREDVKINYIDNTIVANGVMDPPLGIDYNTTANISTNAGTITTTNDGIIATFNGALYIYLSTATTLKNEANPAIATANFIKGAKSFGFNNLLTENTDYIYAIMNRCTIDLYGKDCYNNIPTDKRLENFVNGKYEDTNFLMDYFQFGRYLLLCSSAGALPANLQGLWCKDYNSIWSSDYHININLQMNYWHSEPTNLSHLTAPLFDFFKMMAKHGEKTAKIMYNCRGWVVHTTSTPHGFTAPGEHPSWGSYACGGAWCMRHIWEHYLYTEDIEFLREYYPIIKGCAEFFLDYLVCDPRTGYLVTTPSNSPENTYFDPVTHEVVAMCAGPTMDNSILLDMFNYTIKAGILLGEDKAFLQEVQKTADKLPPIKLGSRGQILEWQEEYEEAEPGHRHLSPLYGLHPVELITKEKTPELFEGAKRLIEERLSHGGGHTGWSRAWIVNFFARLFEGDAAFDHFCKLLGKSTHKNLFDNHPPFQIDGNFGGTAGFCEMLLQSHENFIKLLPALPTNLTHGSVKGVMARGGFEVSFDWDKNVITSLTILSKLGNKLRVKYNNKDVSIDTSVGQKVELS